MLQEELQNLLNVKYAIFDGPDCMYLGIYKKYEKILFKKVRYVKSENFPSPKNVPNLMTFLFLNI